MELERALREQGLLTDVSEVETETETGGETSGEMGSNYTWLTHLSEKQTVGAVVQPLAEDQLSTMHQH